MVIAPTVLDGKEDWLFLSNDSNKVMEQITGRTSLPPDFKAMWASLFAYRAVRLADLGSRYFFGVVPNKECVYRHYLPDGVNFSESRPINKVLEAAQGRVAHQYFLECLEEASLRSETYTKGDTHWNHVGAFVAFNQMMQANCLPQMSSDLISFEDKVIAGDLTGKLGLTTTTKVAVIKSPAFKKVEFNGVQNIGQRAVYENEDKNLPTLLLFRDSFASHQLEMFASMFSRVVALWQPNIDYKVVQDERPDFVFSQQVERFLVSCPDDIRGPSSLEYEAAKKA
ncbi:alginate O-acetyltransferase AlgX-related protein [Agrobacterium tumefaciens]|uniref:alginate O-acetyltransferase AlgX-related protein n=1 Tax=Agrobacterium tumefaciens TaxID=358 RepID=UPI000DD05BE6|nr:hypothetical protein [Rhizobium nepotum]NSY09616.1 hypothetical protein [Agrobacterium tumefaciens]NSZ09441.1 hypothetical protein [Agrobacterium tumefaciens]NTC81098.1 hypothetical protein [Agrobacterium tumefaciens]NTD09571.1 hypothetical protein [Agrobacterium tumefaciens]